MLCSKCVLDMLLIVLNLIFMLATRARLTVYRSLSLLKPSPSRAKPGPALHIMGMCIKESWLKSPDATLFR
jgi:hypothetical protein